jgi:hypothetical protein
MLPEVTRFESAAGTAVLGEEQWGRALSVPGYMEPGCPGGHRS